MIDPKLLEILACPACDDRPPVEQSNHWIFCNQCHRAYPVKDDIPIMLVEEAVICDTGHPPAEPPQ